MTATRRLPAILAANAVGYSRLLGADEAATLAHRPYPGGPPVPRGDRRRPEAVSGEERGKRRRRVGVGGRNAMTAMVSPVGLEPRAPRLKVRRADQEKYQ